MQTSVDSLLQNRLVLEDILYFECHIADNHRKSEILHRTCSRICLAPLTFRIRAPFEKVLQDNIRSIDYQYLVLLNHKSWIEEAQRLGMVVNMWTPNSASDLMKCIVAGADCITTDNSDDLTNIIKTYFPD